MNSLAGWVGEGADTAATCDRMVRVLCGREPDVRRRSATVTFAARSEPLLGGIEAGAVCAERGPFTVLADARIDDQPQLRTRLGNVQGDGAALIVAGWARWGDAVLDLLVGDFAFVLWDQDARALHLVCDVAAARPLFFARIGTAWAFASMPSALRPLPGLDAGLERDLLRNIAAGVREIGGLSCYRGILQVEAGEHVQLRCGGEMRRRFYWQPTYQPVRRRDPRDYGEGLREVLGVAVADRMRGETRVASQLSGGLDSSAVTATAARIMADRGDVLALTAIPGGPVNSLPARFADERHHAGATAAWYANVRHLCLSSCRHFSNLWDDAFRLFQQPLGNPSNHGWSWTIYDAVRADGRTVLLNGQGGNLAFSASGQKALWGRLKAGRIVSTVREVAAMRRQGWSLHSIARELLPPTFSGLRGRLRREDQKPVGLAMLPRRPSQVSRQSVFDGQVAAFRAMRPGPVQRGIFHGWGIDLRDPTSDRRVLDFAFSIPAEALVAEGYNRAPARAALAGLVPDTVRLETRLGYQAGDWFADMRKHREALLSEVEAIACSEAATTLVDVERIRQLLMRWPERETIEVESLYRYALPRALAVGAFARRAVD